MQLVSFDPFRTLGIPGVRYLKPDRWLAHLDWIRAADWLLFPDYWQVHALHYALDARIFPSLATYQLGHDKIALTRAIQARWPSAMPETWILANTPEQRAYAVDRLGFPLVAKTPRASEGRGVFRIDCELDWRRYCEAHDVLYVQELLPIDRDLRIAMIGREVVGSYWRVRPERGFLNNLAAGGALDFSPAPPAALDLVREIGAALDLDHVGFDVAMVDGEPRILEFNRLFGSQGLRAQGIDPPRLIHAELLERARTGWRPRGGRPIRPKRAA